MSGLDPDQALGDRSPGDPGAVAAILVASIRLHFLDVAMNMNYRGAAEIDCDAPFRKGDELGWFEHWSTIIWFAPPDSALRRYHEGTPIRMGRALHALAMKSLGRRRGGASFCVRKLCAAVTLLCR